MKKLKCFLGKRKEELFGCHITAGAGARGMRPGRSGQSDYRGHFLFFPAAPKCFGCATTLQIGGSPTRALSPRRWAMPSGISPQSGRSMVEMLAVLAIIGVLSVAALAGFTYAMNKHRANTIYNDVHLLALHVMDTGKDTVPSDFYPDSGKTFTLDTTTYADGFVVKVADISEKVCDRIMEVNDPSIEKIYVGSEETTSCSGTQDMGFMFLYDGMFTSGGGSSGGTSGGSGSGTDPVDPCEGIVCQYDGMCIDGVCRCVDGYSGDYCEIEPGLCQGIVCDGCRQCDPTDGLCKDSDALCGDEELCTRGVCEEETNALRVCKTSDELMAKLERCQNWCATHTQCNITVGCRIEASVTPNGQCGGPLNTHRCGVLYDNGSNGWNYYSAEYIYVCT